MDELIYLVSFYYTTDDIGQQIQHKQKRVVYGKIKSIGQKEFFEANVNNMKASIKIEMYSFEYNDETMCIVDDKIYGIYRTYKNADKIELYLEDKGGVF